ncbi:helicase C-terminal domain-containing protein [Thalassolituus marinus]|uniref:Helicase ATP-binding domain-containing protein n=1 Tax=Thalassolituus marinus TaxID=671053 RepID=A0ABS7ZY98_9GAMM|nr:helicase C-terminal domain-containing protein [Thalassolituus marinus]MCA6065345.1 hypothetical protein [Thalassolituus marinus]
MLIDSVVSLTGGADRPVQQRLFNDLINNSTGLALFNAGTGIGKTLAYLAAHIQSGGSVVVAVPNHQLARQVMSSIDDINMHAGTLGIKPIKAGLRLGRQEYLSPDRVSVLFDAYTADSDKDDARLWNELLAAANASDDSNLIQNFIAEFGELPSGITANDICCSADDKSSRALVAERENEQDLDAIIVSHITLIATSGFNSLPKKFRIKGRLIVDEADALIHTAEMLYSRRISVNAIARKSALNAEIGKAIDKLLPGIERLGDGIHFLMGMPDVWLALTNLAEVAAESLGDHPFVTQLYRFFELSARNAAISVIKGKATLLQLSTFAARVFAARIDGYASVWLLSGTLDITSEKEHSAKWLCKKLGISDAPHFYGHYEPQDYGRASFTLGRGPVAIKNEVVSQEFIGFCAANISGTMLVCTGSHDETERLTEAIRTLGRVSVIEDRPGTSMSKVIQSFAETPDPVVLVTARAAVGTDIRASDGTQRFRKMMITRLPFSPPPDMGDVEWRADRIGVDPSKVQSWYFQDSLQTSVRRFVQTIGRGIRTEHDECEFLIMDKRMPDAGAKGSNTIFRDAIPERFFRDYMRAQHLSEAGCAKSEEVEIFI